MASATHTLGYTPSQPHTPRPSITQQPPHRYGLLQAAKFYEVFKSLGGGFSGPQLPVLYCEAVVPDNPTKGLFIKTIILTQQVILPCTADFPLEAEETEGWLNPIYSLCDLEQVV